MGSFSLVHWIVLAVVAILLLGGGRFSNMMGDVAKGIKQFKKGMADEDEPMSKRMAGASRRRSRRTPRSIAMATAPATASARTVEPRSAVRFAHAVN